MPKLMVVVAHPDDECFAFGGALALAADRGIESYVLCLTDGQAATHRGEAASGPELGAIRRAEFAASCRVLGVTHHEMLDLSDGRMEFADFPRTAGRIVERMRRFRPDVVLTFGAEGGLNSHTDHTIASLMTTAAFHWAGRAKRYPDLALPFQPQRLYTLSSNALLDDQDATGKPRPVPLLAPWTVTLDITSVRERKAAAFREHHSQAPLIDRTRAFFEQHGAAEYYTLQASATLGPAAQATDLFEGLATS